MSVNTSEISSIIKEQIRSYRLRAEMTETGTVVLVGDGIARVYGLRNCMSGELVEFEDGTVQMVDPERIRFEDTNFGQYAWKDTTGS